MKRVRKFTALFIALAMVVTMAVPGTIKANAASKKYVKSLKVASKVTVEKGKTKKITPKVKVVKKASKEVTVTSKKPSIAKASYKKGKINITGKKVGSTTVTVKTKAKNKKGKKLKKTIKVTVKKTESISKVTTTGASSTTQAVVTDIKVTGITLSKTSASILKGASVQLTAQVAPENATNKEIVWSSSKSSVASVVAGKVTANASGTAVIKATNTNSNVSASCNVTVLDSVEVTTQQQLDDVLNSANVGQIILAPASGSSITIPEGSYSDTTLIVNGKGSEITNKGKFTEIFVHGGSYVEDANGNVISVKVPSDIKINKDASATVNVNVENGTKADEVKIVNDGVINELAVKSGCTVRLTGEAEETVTSSISSENVKLVSNQNLDLSCTAKAEVVLTGDTSETTIKVDKEANIPEVYGVGTVPVDYGTGTTVVEAQPSDELDPVTIIGDVVDAYEETKVADVAVRLVPTASGEAIEAVPTASEEAIEAVTTASGEAIEVVTSADGSYKFDSVACQNYNLEFKKEGYKTAVQTIAPNSRYGDFTNQTIELLSSEKEDNGRASIQGVVNDAANKDGVAGITVELRSNLGNIVGEPIKRTVTSETGSYSFTDLTSGYYTLYTIDSRDGETEKYISVKENICLKADTTENKNMTISKSIKGSGVRFVLTWGSQGDGVPSDLDSHIYGPRIDGREGMFEVYYSEKGYGFGTTDYTVLDVDERRYNGPETVTIVQPVEGIYYYYVYNYSGAEDGDGSLTTSQAKVDIYSGSELLTTYNVPTTGEGNWWKVCSYNSKTGKITAYNSIGTDGFYEDDYGYGENNAFHGYEKNLISVESPKIGSCDIYTDDIYIVSDYSWGEIKEDLTITVAEGYEYTLDTIDNKEYLIIHKGQELAEVYEIHVFPYEE